MALIHWICWHCLLWLSWCRWCFDIVMKALNTVSVTEETVQSKLVGFGCDGASVMMGKTSGVAKRMKDLQPSLFTVQCLAYRLELAFKVVVKEQKLYDSTIVSLEYITYTKIPQSSKSASGMHTTAWAWCHSCPQQWGAPDGLATCCWLWRPFSRGYQAYSNKRRIVSAKKKGNYH